jgi:hypothetical protein
VPIDSQYWLTPVPAVHWKFTVVPASVEPCGGDVIAAVFPVVK